MKNETSLSFRIASEDWEFEAVHRLNYKTFVEEIPQHARNPEQRLVDKFHPENTYAICFDGDKLVGMVTGRGTRPFSLDHKVENLDAVLPPGHRVLEVRLLSVEKDYRTGFVFCGLVKLLTQHFRDLGFDLAIISGTLRQQKLYKHLGFVPFGPITGTGDAQFQPMYLTLEGFLNWSKAVSAESESVQRILASYLPGPVDVHEEVRKAFERGPVSHRSDLFTADFRATKRLLCQLTGAKNVEILLGSGSLANDAIGAQIQLLGRPGIILTNGEFGDRLVDHASRLGLAFEILARPWGEPHDYEAIRERLQSGADVGWIWAVHCETSTGILNDIAALRDLCAAHDVKLCLDCISSIGTVPVPLEGVYLASCVSGKGLAAFPGLSMVFYNHTLQAAPKSLPRYLDLGYYAEQAGIPFTHSSNLVYALQAALKRTDWPAKFAQIREVAGWLRGRLAGFGLSVLAPESCASPAVFTVMLPVGTLSSKTIGWQLRKSGFLLSYQSGYLLQRNWIQICLMGEWSRENLATLPDVLCHLCAQHLRSAPSPALAAAN